MYTSLHACVNHKLQPPERPAGGAYIRGEMTLCRKFALKRGGGLIIEGGVLTRQYGMSNMHIHIHMYIYMYMVSGEISVKHYFYKVRNKRDSQRRQYKQVVTACQ